MDNIAEQKSVWILGVKVDALTKLESLSRASDFLSDGKQHTIFTPNPEMLVAAHRDSYLREILNCGSLNICDGKGIEIVSEMGNLRHGSTVPSRSPRCDVTRTELRSNDGKWEMGTERITGIDFMLDICGLAEREHRSVYLLGSGDAAVIKCVAKNLQQMFPKLTVAGYHHGPMIIDRGSLIMDQKTDDAVIVDILAKTPDILFVGFGHSKQEKWIHEYLPQLPSVKIAMGVGGAFDIVGGKLKRAPRCMRRLGLEWLWRLILEPRRIRRIWTAVVVFPILVLFDKD